MTTDTAVQTYQMYINGRWQDAKSGQTFAVRNPATGDLLANVADGGVDEVKAAIEAANSAFPAWANTPAEQRSKLIDKAANLLWERLDQVARILTQENGKPLAESKGETNQAAQFLEWHAEEAKRIYGLVVPPAVQNRRVLTYKQPVGVVAAITPWNFPASMITRKIAPALAAGCTVVLRPARATPLTAIEIFKIFDEVGFPAGVVNLVTGTNSPAMGEEMATNPLVRKLTFTGSTEIGKHLLQLAAGTVKRVSLELGGHAPSIVFDDADLDLAAQAVVASRFRNAGQTCICTNRVYVQRPVVEAFQQKITEIVRGLAIGNGLEPETKVGPLIDEKGFQKVQEHVQDAVAKGAHIAAGGKPAKVNGELKGYFFEPTVLTNVRPDMRVMYEETFGPVLPVMPFDTDEEAVQMANNTEYGLAAYFYARDVGRIFRVSEQLEYGIVGVNDPVPTGPHIPFGGYKESGLGRENGAEGIDHFVEVKAVSIGI